MNAPLYAAWVARFEVLEAELNKLDAATGDGDHGATMLKGLKAVLSSVDASASADATGNTSVDPAEQASAVTPAKAFRKAAGGASGSLFGLLVGALDQMAREPLVLQEQLQEAARKITDIGEAVAGDKTLLDALIPASQATTISAALRAAQAGYERTESMAARRGRARHVEGAGVGYRDAGARSVVELLAVVAEMSSREDKADRATDDSGDGSIS